MFDVITMGSATIDTFVDTGSSLFQKSKDKIIIPFGTKIRIEHMQSFTGGGGTNTAVGFARMGLRTAYLGVIGTDHHGNEILRELNSEHVNTRLVSRGEHTGTSIILDSTNNDRIILAHKGCNDDLNIPPSLLSTLRTRWIYSSSLMRTSFLSFLKVVTYAKKHDIHVAFNPSAYQIKDNKQEILDLIPKLDALVFNLEEANLLFGIRKPAEHLRNIYNKGVRRIAITDGKRGAYIQYDDHTIHSEAPHARVVETTGAGDAFACGFISAIIKGEDAKTAATIGSANAGSVISHNGAKHELLTWQAALRHRVKTRAIR